MLPLDIEQGSEEWFRARAGIPTASAFKKFITTKGEPSKSALDYAFLLAGERISGMPEESYSNYHMDRGRELEPVARDLYEFITDYDVDLIGICYRDESKDISCSPDGLIGKDGGVEIKCPSLAVHTKYLHGGKCPTEYFQQVQGSMFVTGRKWWDFVSYHPNMQPLIVRCWPDEAFFEALEREYKKLNEKVQQIVEKVMV